MPLEENIKTILKDHVWANDLWILTCKKFHKLRLLLEKDAELPPGMGERLEYFFFSMIYLTITKNPEHYLFTKNKYIGNKSPLSYLAGKDPNGKIINQIHMNERACNYLINSFIVLPELLLNHSTLSIENLNKLNNNLDKQIAELNGQIKVFKKALEDDREKVKKMIDSMAESYIETCRKYKTYKPRNWQLANISGVDERTWKTQKNNEIFLKHFLLVELIKIFNNAKKKRPFWQKAIDFVNTKIDFIGNPDKFKLKYGYDEKIDSEFKTGSKTDKVRAAEIKQKQNDVDRFELQCIICGEAIENGELCEGCLEEFPIRK